MDWKQCVFLFLAHVLLLGTVQGQSQPTIVTPSGQTWYSYVGAIVSMNCQVQNLGTHKVNWVFVKDSTTIFHGNQRLVHDDRYVLMHPLDSNVYSLQIMFAREEDQGTYKCEVEGTKQAATMQLLLEGAPALSAINTTGNLNRTSCCQERGLSQQCLPVCNLPSSGAAPVIAACESYLRDFVYCGSDGRNHEDCCARSGVAAGCLLFCSNDQDLMPQVGSDEQHCLLQVDAIISCYQYGAALLPSPPEAVSVISVSRNGSYSLQVSWKRPLYNPSAVSGYRVHYKQAADPKFMATQVLNAATNTYSLAAQVNTEYTVYVTAKAHHGASQPSNRISILVQDTSSPSQVTDVESCCESRNVPLQCQMTLCHPRLWAHFDVMDLIECYSFLPDVISCLNGEVDHSGCCSANNVPAVCVGLCSGHPPPFNTSLASCIPKLSIVEACIQTGLGDQPRPPQHLRLSEVGSHHVVVVWTAPDRNTSAPVNAYYVQLRRGNESSDWKTVAEVVGTFFELTNLTETETYALRVISSADNASSLPSAVLWFTTYPERVPEGRPTIAHNITQCCVDSGMPAVCAEGCRYQANMTVYYQDVLATCLAHIGTVLTCAADGRDHTPCCRQRGVQEVCHDLCFHNAPGALDFSYLDCVADTAKIVQCYEEGLVDLVRMPEEVEVRNITSHTISLQWKNPETGPPPQYYLVTYLNLHTDTEAHETTEGLRYILQNLVPGTAYSITLTSFLNDSSSPPTSPITAFTPPAGSSLPFLPSTPSEAGLAMWANRTHCCQSSSISPGCRGVCLNRPAANATDCSHENHNILACAADGQDHRQCCEEHGLPLECLPLCGRHASTSFTVQLAGCLADARISIVTSCFLANSGLLPSAPFEFRARNEVGRSVLLEWSEAVNCEELGPCRYNVHYWPANTSSPDQLVSFLNVTSPFSVEGLVPGHRYTFTVTAYNSRGGGPPAPWVTLFYEGALPDVSIAQSPKTQVFEQGTTVYLTCDAFNLPTAPRFTWRLRSRLLPSRGRVLRLYQVTERSEGNYSCTVTSGQVSVSAWSYVNVRFKPQFAYFRTDTVAPNVGGEAVLACWFRGHPSTNNPSAVWTKDGRPLSRTPRHSITVTSRYHTGITAFKVKIGRLEPSDYGMYQCRASNQYGSATAHTKLADPNKIPRPPTPTPGQKRNMSRCCQARGVIELCMPLCSLEVSTEEALMNPNKYGICLLFFSEMIECAADGADHSLCCKDKVIPDTCLSFCKGQVPPVASLYNAPHLLQCVHETPDILDCMDRGYGKIPTAPRHLVASFVSDKIKVSWEPPSRNPDRVTSYNIYYNFTGNPVIQTETVTSAVGFNHVLQNVDEDHAYHIWMTAEAYKFGQSQVSETVSISTSGTLPPPPTRLRVESVKGNTVVVSWVAPTSGSVRAEAFAVYYKPRNAIRASKNLTTKTRITLKNLKPFTEYEVSVASRSMAGEGRRTASALFTTQQRDQDEPDAARQGSDSALSGGQVAGIVLAVVVVIAISILLLVLLYRSHVGRKRQAETVSFQNPSYGNQQVHIGGLPPNNPYDNVMEPQTQPEENGSFSYARLKEDPAPPSDLPAKPASAPDSAYATPADPGGITLQVDSNGAVSGSDLKNESQT